MHFRRLNTMTSVSTSHRSLAERAGHAITFELIALAVCAPALAWLMDRPLAHVGALTLMFSIIAMLWNMIFNMLFDQTQRRMRFKRGLAARLLHASLFEVGLIVLLVPLASWWLSIGLLEAFLLDIGLILFFLPYTVSFNWGYDLLRERYVRSRQGRAGTFDDG